MTVYAQPLNQDQEGVATSAKYLNRGDGTSEWYHTQRVFDGGDVTQGLKADVAVTAVDSTPGSVIALLKGIISTLTSYLGVGATRILKLEDAAHASGDAGIMALAVRKDSAAASSGTTGDYEPLQTDATGQLRTVVGGTVTVAQSVTPTNVTTTAYTSSLVIKASAGRLYGIQGYNSLASTQFIQLHDASSVPADTAVPKIIIAVPASSNFSVDFGPYGRQFATGIALCNSTTGPTKTIGAADIWVDAQFV